MWWGYASEFQGLPGLWNLDHYSFLMAEEVFAQFFPIESDWLFRLL